jgi:hypothetical protein
MTSVCYSSSCTHPSVHQFVYRQAVSAHSTVTRISAYTSNHTENIHNHPANMRQTCPLHTYRELDGKQGHTTTLEAITLHQEYLSASVSEFTCISAYTNNHTENIHNHPANMRQTCPLHTYRELDGKQVLKGPYITI